MQVRGYRLPRIPLPRTPVNRGAGAWQLRLLLLFEKQLLLLSVGQRGTHGEFLRTPQRLEDDGITLRRGVLRVDGDRHSEGRGIKPHL
jgi:hypothetical protein